MAVEPNDNFNRGVTISTANVPQGKIIKISRFSTYADPWRIIGCVLAVPWMYNGCNLADHWLCLGCALDVDDLDLDY